jgi:hypothetical protein
MRQGSYAWRYASATWMWRQHGQAARPFLQFRLVQRAIKLGRIGPAGHAGKGQHVFAVYSLARPGDESPRAGSVIPASVGRPRICRRFGSRHRECRPCCLGRNLLLVADPAVRATTGSTRQAHSRILIEAASAQGQRSPTPARCRHQGLGPAVH